MEERMGEVDLKGADHTNKQFDGDDDDADDDVNLVPPAAAGARCELCGECRE